MPPPWAGPIWGRSPLRVSSAAPARPGQIAPKRKKRRPAAVPIFLLCFRPAWRGAALAMLSSSPRLTGPGFPCLAFLEPWPVDRLPVPLAVFPGLDMPCRPPPPLELERVSLGRPPGSPGAPPPRAGAGDPARGPPNGPRDFPPGLRPSLARVRA